MRDDRKSSRPARSIDRNQLKDQVNCFFSHGGFNPALCRL